MISLKKQTVIIIDGSMGSGKTAVANILHKKVRQLVYLGSDRIKWSQSDFKRTTKEILISLNVVLSMMNTYLSNGMNIIVVENFIDKKMRDKFISLSKKSKAELFIYHLSSPRKILLERISKRSKKHEKEGIPPLPKSFILKNLNLHAKNRHVKAKVIQTSGKSPEKIANLILKEIQKN